jgi:hypothetical protein
VAKLDLSFMISLVFFHALEHPAVSEGITILYMVITKTLHRFLTLDEAAYQKTVKYMKRSLLSMITMKIGEVLTRLRCGDRPSDLRMAEEIIDSLSSIATRAAVITMLIAEDKSIL